MGYEVVGSIYFNGAGNQMHESLQAPEVVTGLPLFSSAGSDVVPDGETRVAPPSVGGPRNQGRILIVKGRLLGVGSHSRPGLALIGRIRNTRA